MELSSATEQKSLLATLAPGKRTRLRRLLFEFGPGNGTLLLLPIDQGIEHGPRDFFPNPASKDPEYQFRLAAEAGYSAIACQIGLAEKYYPDYAGPGAAAAQGQRQDRRAALRRRALDHQRLGRGRGPARRRRGRLHALRRLAAPGPGPAPAQGRARGLRPLRDAARDLGLPARRRRSRRAARTASTRSTTPPGWRWRWAPTWSSSTCRSPDPNKDSPRPTTSSRSPRRRPSQQVVALGRALAGGALGRLEDRRRQAARADPLHHGVRAARA